MQNNMNYFFTRRMNGSYLIRPKSFIPAVILLYLLFLNAPLQGSIQIVGVSNPSSVSACDGSMTVEASGTAGPFTIDLSGPNGVKVRQSGVNGQHLFTGLCDGAYAVKVSNAYECETTLGATLTGFVCTETGQPYRYVNRVVVSIKPLSSSTGWVVIYDAQWTLQGSGCVIFSPSTKTIGFLDALGMGSSQRNVKVEAYATAKMNQMLLELPGAQTGSLSMTESAGNKWEYASTNGVLAGKMMTYSSGQYRMCQQLLFSGTSDNPSGNKPLLDMRDFTGYVHGVANCAPLSVFNAGQCQWSPAIVSGKDDMHVMKHNCTSPLEALPATEKTDRGSGLLAHKLQVQAFPNPFRHLLNLEIQVEYPGALNYLMTDQLGREVLRNRMVMQSTFEKITLELDHLPAGIYNLLVFDDKGNSSMHQIVHAK